MLLNFFGHDHKLANILATLVIVGTLALCATSIGMAVFASGKVTHCYVDSAGHSVPMYRIVGHRDWRKDVIVGVEKTSEEAAAKMKELCP